MAYVPLMLISYSSVGAIPGNGSGSEKSRSCPCQYLNFPVNAYFSPCVYSKRRFNLEEFLKVFSNPIIVDKLGNNLILVS